MKRIIAGLLFALLATSAQAQLVLPGAGGGGVFPFTEPAIKSPAQVATTGANITLSGEQTIDGVLTSASRVLVKDQNTASQNGLYTTGSGAWIRALDFNANGQVVQGTQVYVTQGAVNGGHNFTITTANPITVGTTAISLQYTKAQAWLSSNDFGFKCDGTTDNATALSNGIAAAVLAGAPFHITADASGAVSCAFRSLTTVTSPSTGQNAALIIIDPAVNVLFNGSAGWVKITGNQGGTFFTHSGVIGGQIVADPSQATGSAFAITIAYTLEAVVRDIRFFNGTVLTQPSNALDLINVYTADVTGNFFYNHITGVQVDAGIDGPTNNANICYNEFGNNATAIGIVQSSSFSGSSNRICNNYIEGNAVAINTSQYEYALSIVDNFINQNGCYKPLPSYFASCDR